MSAVDELSKQVKLEVRARGEERGLNGLMTRNAGSGGEGDLLAGWGRAEQAGQIGGACMRGVKNGV